ncbi:MAG TPA: ABC transporter permease [Chthoniobacterales bacterium]|jgi:putative ABC transport system permease protein|nr:ABC transporter permease [Chthoniobacterales bacterium]
MIQDLRFALRQLQKSPGFTAVAVLTLALGIGANTAIFSVINAVLLAPLPYPQADRIMTLNEFSAGTDSAISFPDYLDWRRDNTVFEELAISRRESRNLSGVAGRQPERVGVAFVTANFFKVIGLPAEFGRTFTEDEDKVGGPALAVISDGVWQRVFQKDGGVLGRTISLHNELYTVVGVMPPAMAAPHEVDVWLPIMRRSPAWQNRAWHPMMFGWGRLKAGVTVEQARAEMKAIAARLEKQYPETNAGETAVVTPLLENLVGDYRKNLFLLLSAVGLVLLIACANLANLFAARGAARAREFAIRTAVGASRAQIIRQLLIESLVIAVLGGGLGFLFALWGREALVALGPAGVERFQRLSFDGRVLGFTFLLACLTSIAFGLWPALRTSRSDVQLALKSGGHGSSDTRSARRTRDLLIVGEIALTLVLLTSAGLVLKSFARVQELSLGFDPQGLLTARIDLPFSVYSTAEKVAPFTHALLEKVRALPGAEAAALSANPPMLAGWEINFLKDGDNLKTPPAQQPSTECEVVSPDYFATLKAPLLRGRALSEHDNAHAPLVVVIDQRFAEQAFPGQDPIGKRIYSEPFDEGEGPGWFQIVGVVANMKFRGFEERAPLPVAYFSLGQVKRDSQVLFVRAGARAQSLEKTVHEIVAAVDPAQPIFDVRTMQERVEETWAAQRLLSFLLGIFSLLALALATVGLYGVIAYTALRRLREIALRFALGAQRADIRALVLGHGLRLLGAGLAIGAVGVLASSRLLRSFLFGVNPLDLSIYLGVGLLLALAALLASWLPARRAARVEPMMVLRAE